MSYETLLTELNLGKGHLSIDGPAGSGKSELIKYFCATTPLKVLVTATTGIAAQHLQGRTIHSLLGFRPTVIENEDEEEAEEIEVVNPHVNLDEIKAAHVLIIDEASQLNCQLMDWIDGRLKEIRGNQKPFGGIRLVLVGDHYQLLPVSAGLIANKTYQAPFTYYQSMIFTDREFQKNLKKFTLTGNFRQGEDKKYKAILDRLRVGIVLDEDLKILNKRLLQAFESRPPYLCLTNFGAYDLNVWNVFLLGQQVMVLPGLVKDGVAKVRDMKLAIGAMVYMTKNNPKQGYQNGTLGKIIGFNFDKDNTVESLQVLINGQLITVKRVFIKAPKGVSTGYTLKGQGEGYMQFPVKLAYAITSHRAQGMSLDSMTVVKDCWNGIMPQPHQMYTILSRVRSLNGLFLQHYLAKEDFMVHPVVARYMQDFEKSSILV